MLLYINPELRDELPPLIGEELDNLKRSLMRDGVIDSIKYWYNSETKHDEIVDGHHRYQIASELEMDYETHELKFDSITAAKMWQNVTQAGRRQYKALSRMVELETQLRLERDGEKPTVREVVQTIADRESVGVATVYRSMAKAKMGYEAKGPVGDELDQSLPEENFVEGVTDDEFNQAEPTQEQRQAIKDAQPTKPIKRPQSIVSQQKAALRGYEASLNKIQSLRLEALFDNSLELPIFKDLFDSIEKARAKLPVPKKPFGR